MDVITYALALGAREYGESSKLVRLATFDRGIVFATLRSASKSKLRLAASPLTFGEYSLSVKNKQSTITGCSVEDSFFACWQDMEKYNAAFAVLAMLEKAAGEQDDIKAELSAALRALTAINYNETDPAVFAVWYAARMLEALGVDIGTTSVPEPAKAAAARIASLEPDEADALDITPEEVHSCRGYLAALFGEIG